MLSYWWNWRDFQCWLEEQLRFHLVGKYHIFHERLLLIRLLDLLILEMILLHLEDLFCCVHDYFSDNFVQDFTKNNWSASGFSFSGIDRLDVKDACLHCIDVLRNLPWMSKNLRNWSWTDCIVQTLPLYKVGIDIL